MPMRAALKYVGEQEAGLVHAAAAEPRAHARERVRRASDSRDCALTGRANAVEGPLMLGHLRRAA